MCCWRVRRSRMLARDRESYHKSRTTRPWLYVSSPMRGKWGDSPWVNCHRGILVATTAWHAGWHPIAPQLNGFWEMISGALDVHNADGAAGWLEYDFSFLTRCDALYRIPGESEGADREVALMEQHRKLVLHGPTDPRLADFPRPGDHLEFVSGQWMRRINGIPVCR